MLTDQINVAEWFRAKFPSLARSKEGDLPLLNFSNLTCMHDRNTSNGAEVKFDVVPVYLLHTVVFLRRVQSFSDI